MFIFGIMVAPRGPDVGLFREAARELLHSDGLALYAQNPRIQSGPPAVLVYALPDAVAVWVLPAVLLVVAIFLLSTWGFGGRPLVVIGGVLAWPWAYAADLGHVDDLLATVLLLAAWRAVESLRPELVGLFAGLAIGCKPWAVVGLPLVFVSDRRLRSLVVGSAAAFAVWAPFLAWPGALTATGSWRNTVVLKSPLSLLMTAHESVPGWWRAASLSVVFGVSLGLVLAGRWRAALPVSLVIRLCIEPGWFYYYPVALVACLAVWDLQTRRFPRWVWLGLFFTATYRWREPGAPTVVAAALVVIVGGWRRRDGDFLPVPTLPEHLFRARGDPVVPRPVSNPPRSVPPAGPPGSPRRIR